MVIVDDEALVRSGLEQILQVAGDIDVVATAGGGQAMAAIDRCRPDVVLLDLRMSDVDGLTILGLIRARPEPPAVAILTTFDADEYVTVALRSGAAGFILKDTDPGRLAQLVRNVAAGGSVLPRGFRTPCLEDPASRPAG